LFSLNVESEREREEEKKQSHIDFCVQCRVRFFRTKKGIEDNNNTNNTKRYIFFWYKYIVIISIKELRIKQNEEKNFDFANFVFIFQIK